MKKFFLGIILLTIIISCENSVKNKIEANSRIKVGDEKIGYKIREANGDQKIPVQLIIGKNEVENNEVNVRRFGSQESLNMTVDEIVKTLLEESKVPFKK